MIYMKVYFNKFKNKNKKIIKFINLNQYHQNMIYVEKLLEDWIISINLIRKVIK